VIGEVLEPMLSAKAGDMAPMTAIAKIKMKTGTIPYCIFRDAKEAS
jgi:hypothetical protein